jgi:isocitrate dehydrogenase (NAD+)
MLDHLGDTVRAERIRAALHAVIDEKQVLTRDLGGSASTSQFADAIIAKL